MKTSSSETEIGISEGSATLPTQPRKPIKFRTREGFEPEVYTNRTLFDYRSFVFQFGQSSTIADRMTTMTQVRMYVHYQSQNELPYGEPKSFVDKNGKVVAVGCWRSKDAEIPAPHQSLWFSSPTGRKVVVLG